MGKEENNMRNVIPKIKLVAIKANLCPICGNHPIVMTDNHYNTMICPVCGNSSDEQIYGKLSSMDRALLVRSWNKHTFCNSYSECCLKKLRANEQRYLVFDDRSAGFLKTFEKIEDAFVYMKESYEADHTLKTSLHQLSSEGHLYTVIDSDLVSKIQGGWDGYDDEENLNYCLVPETETTE